MYADVLEDKIKRCGVVYPADSGTDYNRQYGFVHILTKPNLFKQIVLKCFKDTSMLVSTGDYCLYPNFKCFHHHYALDHNFITRLDVSASMFLRRVLQAL